MKGFFIIILFLRLNGERKTLMITRTKYNPKAIVEKWQQQWEAEQLYHDSDNSPRPKFYHVVMVAYPSGDLHMGHCYNYSPFDASGRIDWMHAYDVMEPI